MSIRIVIYTTEGDAVGFSAASQIRSLIHEMRVDASVLTVTDTKQLAMNGIDSTPTVTVDSVKISQGYAPSRSEVQRAISQRVDQLQVNRPPD